MYNDFIVAICVLLLGPVVLVIVGLMFGVGDIRP